MLFEKILTEAAPQGFIEHDILDVLKSTSDIVQTAVTGGGEWPENSTIEGTNGSCFHWTEAEQVAGTDDVQKLIYAYTSTYLLNNRLSREVVESLRSMDIWTHILSNLGFRASENPFTGYVLAYKEFDLNTMRSQLIALNNLYSNYTIKADDLNNKSTILYNKNIWQLTLDNVTSLLDNYYYIKSNRSSFDPNKQASQRLNTLRDRAVEHEKDMENYIVFSDETITSADKAISVTPAYIVNDFVEIFFTGKYISTLSRSLKQNPGESGSAKNLVGNKKSSIDNLFSKEGFKYSDLKDIIAYVNDMHSKGII